MTLIDPEEYKNVSEEDPNYSTIKLKTPKRILHFCDGVLEEYSDDEIDSQPTQTVTGLDVVRILIRHKNNLCNYEILIIPIQESNELRNSRHVTLFLYLQGSLTWGPWTRYKIWLAGSTTLSYMETMGEYLAAFFGITTPKYYFELEEYKKRQSEEQSQKQGWSEPGNKDVEFHDIRVTQPSSTTVV